MGFLDFIQDGVLHICLTNIKEIKSGKQLLTDYGNNFWEIYNNIMEKNTRELEKFKKVKEEAAHEKEKASEITDYKLIQENEKLKKELAILKQQKSTVPLF